MVVELSSIFRKIHKHQNVRELRKDMDLMIANNSLFVNEEHSEWVFMWKCLAEHPLNTGLDEPRAAENNDESWEYMGSSIYDGRPQHAFRHRCHPKTQHPESIFLPVSIDFRSEVLKAILPTKET